ncbi:PREDICTED: claw keratin-like [Gekko japonicus]|uniref:Claw keratin-like n=1 Tax=Gekko japonicus TaxID=146911 RepID=A0ABM1L314_GEKJA|nr:PREDICTED: claw keratin-like [Gekko japonicus]
MSYCGPASKGACGVGSCYGGVTYSGRLPSYGLGSVCGTGGWSGLGALSGGWSGLGTLSGGWSGLGTLSGGWSGLGAQSGGNVACASQLPGSEVVIQPPPSVVTIPGPVLSTCEPAAVAAYTPCATGYSGQGSQALSPLYSGGAWGGYGRLGYGGYRRYGQRCLPYSGWGYGACDPCGPC